MIHSRYNQSEWDYLATDNSAEISVPHNTTIYSYVVKIWTLLAYVEI